LRHTVHLLIGHRERPQVLARAAGEAWALPVVSLDARWLADSSPLNEAVHDAFDIDVSVLRYWLVKLDPQTAASCASMVLHDAADPAPAGLAWIGEDKAGVLTEPGRAAARTWFRELAGDVPHMRAPWMRRGWEAGALAWARAQLKAAGWEPGRHAEQVKHWSISSIYRIPTARGDAWFKAVPGFFAQEGAIMRFLDRVAPGTTPGVIATDAARGWTLMEGIAGETLRGANARHADGLRLGARIQQAAAGRIDELLALGAPDRRLATLRALGGELVAREDIRGQLSAEEARALDGFLETLDERTFALAACGVPETLIHGDFHPGNLMHEGGRIVVVDWTDGCIGHPYFDLATYFQDVDEGQRRELLGAYVECWAPAAGREHAERALALARPLACLHHAISYQQILDGVERGSQPEFGSETAAWLRRLLAS
jgi:aminoglycoside phosphotransferase (APT) family kinase protein